MATYEQDPHTHHNEPAYPNSAEKDRVEGGLTEAKGRVKESIGALTDNEKLKHEGRSDQMVGEGRQKKGQLKNRIKAWIDRF